MIRSTARISALAKYITTITRITVRSHSIMSTQSEEKIASILERNEKYSKTVHVSPPGIRDIVKKAKALGKRGTAIVSCADPRITPEEFLGLEFAEAAIIRNAGGRTRPALDTLLALDSIGNLGTIIVIHHTDCGMSTLSEKEFHDAAKAKHPECDLPVGEVYGAIKNPEESVKADVGYLKSFESWGKAGVEIAGFVLDTESGTLRRVT